MVTRVESVFVLIVLSMFSLFLLSKEEESGERSTF